MVNHGQDPPAGDEWAIHRWANGCIHLRMQHLTLTFSPGEFAQFARLVCAASVQFALPMPAAPASRPS